MSMKLGDYTFALNPSDMAPPLYKEVHAASVQTISAAAFYQFGPPRIEGLIVTLSWDTMAVDQYESLQTLAETPGEKVFDLYGDAQETYNVNILSLTGRYFLFLGDNALSDYEAVELRLIVMSENA